MALKESVNKIYNYLKTNGCCDTCCLRYCNGRGDDYNNVSKSLELKGIVLKSDGINIKPKGIDAKPEGINIKPQESDTKLDKNDIKCKEMDIKPDGMNMKRGGIDLKPSEDVCVIKRKKSNACIACLGLFEENCLENVLQTITNHPDIVKFECNTVLTSISLPIILHLRQLSIWFGLLENFPKHFKKDIAPDTPLKEIFKQLINPKVCEKIGKTFEQNQNGLSINIFFEHEKEKTELQALQNVNLKYFKERYSTPRKFHRQFLTRNAFEQNFTPAKIDRELFANHIPIPGEICANPIKLEKVTIQGPIVFVAGRYKKLCRELSQTPWVLHGKRVMEDSVQEFIVAEIAPYFDVPLENVNFSSSGREDVDVRCLGKGRPFVLEISNSKKERLDPKIAAEMELAIAKSVKVAVRDLQMVKREDLVHIKSGEESKKKIYRALCVLKEPATLDVLQKLNISEPFIINQWTPLRVLHRRPLHLRPKTIHNIKAHLNKDDHRQLILEITTQAGAYVKELVHGEFGRTSPSLCSIIGQWIDIVALDVIAIDLDWPLEMNNEKHLLFSS